MHRTPPSVAAAAVAAVVAAVAVVAVGFGAALLSSPLEAKHHYSDIDSSLVDPLVVAAFVENEASGEYQWAREDDVAAVAVTIVTVVVAIRDVGLVETRMIVAGFDVPQVIEDGMLVKHG